MGILALDKGLHVISTSHRGALIVGCLILGILLAVLIAHIHRTEDIGLALELGTLILTGAGLVESLHPVVGLLEVRTIACFVAQ